jgi:hypothetical protein
MIANDFPLWREIDDAASCRLLVDQMDPADIARDMRCIIDFPGEATEMGRTAVEHTYNWKAKSTKLIELYRRRLPAPEEGLPT